MARPFDLKTMSSAEHSFLIDRSGGWENKVINVQTLESRIHFDHPSTWSPPKQPLASLGQLGTAPPEIQYIIFENTDLATLMRLRATNSHFKTLIEQWTPFRTIMQHAPNQLRALIATGAANIWTAPQLASVIFTDRCELCGELGIFLQLLKLARCCFRCLAHDRRLLSVDLNFATGSHGMNISSDEIVRIPRLITIPRKGSWGRPEHIPKILLLDYTAAQKFARPHQKIPSAGSPTILKRRKEDGPFTKKAILPHEEELNLSAGLCPPECTDIRFLTAIHFPALTKTVTYSSLTSQHNTHITQHLGNYCRGCRHYWNLKSQYHHTEHRLFSSSEIDAHLSHCVYARLWWNKLYPAGFPIDPVRTIEILGPKRPFFARAFSFEVIPNTALQFLQNADNDTYGDSVVGWEGESQAWWATRTPCRSGILLKYVCSMLERESRSKRQTPRQLRRFAMDSKVVFTPYEAKTMCYKGIPFRDVQPLFGQAVEMENNSHFLDYI